MAKKPMSGKTILITGASRGIGAEIARQAGRQGYNVGVNYQRNKDAADALVEEIRAAGGCARAFQADVADPVQVDELFSELDAVFTGLDVLVNNAGVLSDFRVDMLDPEVLERVFQTNLFSVFYCSRHAIKRMSTACGGAGGSIINMSSVASRLGGLDGGVAYAASKGAVDAFTIALAREVGHEGIRVNALRPGLIETDIHEVHGGLAQMRERAKIAVPLGRAGSASEVASVTLWLATEAASYVHGSIMDVSGGR